MSKRKSISKTTRFEVFKRDKFACQYCGRAAPDVLLQVDHIHPVSKGGEEEITNLITACKDCNAGKSDRELGDDAAIKKQKRMLDELQARREQLEMMLEWQRGLMGLEEEQTEGAANLWRELVPGYYLNDAGVAGLRKLIRKFGLLEVLESMRIAVDAYLKIPVGQENPTQESVDIAWKCVGGICANRKTEREKPDLAAMYHARNILRKRCGYVDGDEAMRLMHEAYGFGYGLDELKVLASTHRSYWEWRDEIAKWIADADSTT